MDGLFPKLKSTPSGCFTPLERRLVFARLIDGDRSGAGVRRTVEFATGFGGFGGLEICRSSIPSDESSALSGDVGGIFLVGSEIVGGALTVSNIHPSSSSFGVIVFLAIVSTKLKCRKQLSLTVSRRSI